MSYYKLTRTYFKNNKIIACKNNNQFQIQQFNSLSLSPQKIAESACNCMDFDRTNEYCFLAYCTCSN